MNKKIKTLFSKVSMLAWVLFLPLCIPLITGCSTYSSVKKKTKRIVRDYKAPDEDLKKRVGIAFFKNKTPFVGKGLEESFNKDLVETIKTSCQDILVLEPYDSGYPAYLTNLPTKTSGLIDNFDLAKTGRHLGLNAVVTGALIDITNHKEVRGILWFKDTHNYAQVQVMTEVYDTQTGAKLLDKSYTHRIEDEDILYDDASYYDSTDRTGEISTHTINDALKLIAEDMGEQICDAIVLQPWKGFITSTFAEKVVISSGEKVGIALGDIFEVYNCNGVFTGVEKHRFFIPGLKTGEIKITKVYPDRAEGVRFSGQNIETGCSIRLKD
ncbi:MAG: hypothetical protein SRB2_04422 [Desulfobacteraceae bacterium Eth-SRB2]|nr:MAG: hypothetical protein SRB2_04422 [Desulfobacteraceae bacterium Eth-SRB2]